MTIQSNGSTKLSDILESPFMIPVHIFVLMIGAILAFIYTVCRHILPNIAIMVFDRVAGRSGNP